MALSFQLAAVLILLGMSGVLYQKYTDKTIQLIPQNQYEKIRQHLLNEYDDDALVKETRPLMWVYVPHEYNTRKWNSFGSRSTTDLNQPYLQLTAQSLVKYCGESFRICFIDETSFQKLIPGWKIDLTRLSGSMLGYVRQLAMAQLLYIYGGLQVPLSFLCFRDLIIMFNKQTRDRTCMFICENTNVQFTPEPEDFYPDTRFMGAPKENTTIHSLIQFMQRTISTDYTAESEFLGEFNQWCNRAIQSQKATLVSGSELGVKTADTGRPILLNTLLGTNYVDVSGRAYGIWIPADEVLSRTAYVWFARMSHKQILESRFILAKYFILALAPDASKALNNSPAYPAPTQREGMQGMQVSDAESPMKVGKGTIRESHQKPDWVGFWHTPLGAIVWGVKPAGIGDNIQRKIRL